MIRARGRAWLSYNPSRLYLQDWLGQAARTCPPGTRVLDAGAGEAPYRDLFAHCDYRTADFGAVDKAYAELDYVCDLTDIPVPDGSFDVVVCTQTMEHLPRPIMALTEFRRVLVSDGQVWLTAPLFYAEHEAPYDFHRYTQYAWDFMASEAGFEVVTVDWLEGYLGTLGYQLAMAASDLPRWMLPLRLVFGAIAGCFLRLDRRVKIVDRGMCKNYRVVLRPTAATRESTG